MIATASASRMLGARSRVSGTSLQVRNRLFPRRDALITDWHDDFFVLINEACFRRSVIIAVQFFGVVCVGVDGFYCGSWSGSFVRSAANSAATSSTAWLAPFLVSGFRGFAGFNSFRLVFIDFLNAVAFGDFFCFLIVSHALFAS